MEERSVTILPPRLNRQKQETKADEKPKLKVAAYCRVSTDSDEQATSYETQIEHYTLFIQNNPEWVLAGIFADERNAMLIRYIWLRIVIVTNMQ